MKKPALAILSGVMTASSLNGDVYNVTSQSQFDAAVTSSQASAVSNTINANVTGGVAIDSATIFSGNPPNTLTLNVNGVNGSGSTPFNINFPLTINAEGTITLNPSPSIVAMDVVSSLTQTGGSITANGGSTIAIPSGGTYAFNGGQLQLGGTNPLTVASGGSFTIGGTSETLQVIQSDLTLNIPIVMTGMGNLFIDTNGFNATLSGTLDTPVNSGGVPVVNKIGLGNLNFSNLTMTGGGEVHILQGTSTVEGTSQIPYYSVGNGSGSNAEANFNDPSMVLLVKTFTGNESGGIHVGDFKGVGVLNQTAGTVNLVNASLDVSNQGGEGVYNLSGGVINCTGGLMNIGRNTLANPPSTGIFNLSGNGLFIVDTISSYLILGSRSGGTSSGIFNQTGGTLKVTQGGTFWLSSFGNGTYNLEGGTLQIGDSALKPHYSGGAGTYQFNFGNGTIQVIESDFATGVNINLLAGQSGTIDTNNFNANLSGILSGPGSLTKINNGTLTLSNNNTYQGPTYVNGGTVQAGVVNAFSPNSSIILANTAGATLDLNNLNQMIGSLAGGGSQGGVVQLGSANLYVGYDNTNTTFSGQITGSGSLIKTGSGTLDLLGNNNYTGGTLVNQGVLEGNTTSLQGAIVVNTGAALTFNQTSNGVFNGVLASLSGASLNKIGSGSLTFNTSNSGFLGTTHVTDGNLILNNVLGGSAQVTQQGTLSGLGNLLGNLTVDQGGTFAPDVGTFTIGGDLTITSSGNMAVQINGSGKNSFVHVAQDANLSGNLIVNLAPGVNTKATYDILHSDTQVKGAFTKAISSNPLFIPLVSYLAQEVLLTFGLDPTAIAVTKNQKAVANQLKKIVNTTNPALQKILDEIVTLGSDPSTVPKILRAYDEMGGQQYTHRALVAEMSVLETTRRIYDLVRPVVTSLCREPCSWNGILEGGGGHARFKGNRDTDGFELSSYNITGAVQGRLDPLWTLGAAVSYENQSVEYLLTGRSTSNNGMGAVYATFRPNGYYVFGTLFGGYDTQSFRRPIRIGSLSYVSHSKPSASQGSAYVEGGLDCCVQNILMQPFVGVEFEYIQLNGFSEKGGYPLNLKVDRKNFSAGFGNLGVHSTLDQGGLKASLDLFWQSRFTSLNDNIYVRFETFGDRFKIRGAPLANNSFNGWLTLDARAGILDFFLEAGLQAWSQATLYQVLGGVRACW